MKKIILILSLITINFGCIAQNNTINSNELTINGINFLWKNINLVPQHFGQPNLIEDYYYEMDDIMSQKYIYYGIVFYAVDGKIDSFEITKSDYYLTTHNIKVGDDISILQVPFPKSYRNKASNSLTIRFLDEDRYLILFFNNNNEITLMRLGSY